MIEQIWIFDEIDRKIQHLIRNDRLMSIKITKDSQIDISKAQPP